MVINTEYIGPMIYEFCVAGIAAIVIGKIGQKYHEKRNNVTKYMFLFSFLLNFSVFISAISRVLRVTNLWLIGPDTYLELLAFTVSFVAVANIFLLAFALEVFADGMDLQKNKMIVLIYSAVVAVFVIYSLATALVVKGFENTGLNDSIWIFLILISTVVYVYTIQAAWKVARKAEDKLQKRSTEIIALSPLSFLTVFVFFMIDSLLGDNFTIYYYIGYAFAIVCVFTLYIGVVRPGWFVKLVKE